MKFIHARQVWTESQHESNVSISQAAEQRAEVATKLKTVRSRKQEVVFRARDDDEEEVRVKVPRQRISIAETRRTPIGKSTARAAHLVAMGKVQRAIGTLPFQVQQFGHYLYHPCMTVIHMLNAEKLIWNDMEFPQLTGAKLAKVHCLVTCALQSYKAEANGGDGWGPAKVADAMQKLYGVHIEPKHWDRDWVEVWNFMRQTIIAVDAQALRAVWQVIDAEKDDEAA